LKDTDCRRFELARAREEFVAEHPGWNFYPQYASESKLGRVVTRFPAHAHETKDLQKVLTPFTGL